MLTDIPEITAAKRKVTQMLAPLQVGGWDIVTTQGPYHKLHILCNSPVKQNIEPQGRNE